MKRQANNLLIFAMLLICSILFSQEQTTSQPDAKTKIEMLQRQTGSVIIKEYSVIGTTKGMGTVVVNCMVLTNASTGSKSKGILIEVTESGRFEKSDRSFIDYDEIDPLIAGIDYISKADTSIADLDNFEAIYKTKGDFSIVTFSSTSGKIDVAVKSGIIGSSTAFFSIDQLNELRNLISVAKQRLDSLE